MLKIRLSRSGAKKAPYYRIVVTEARSKRGGKPLEVLGSWNPRKNEVSLDRKKIEKWIENGAKLTEKVKSLAKFK